MIIEKMEGRSIYTATHGDKQAFGKSAFDALLVWLMAFYRPQQ